METVAEDRELQADLLKTNLLVFDHAVSEVIEEVRRMLRNGKGIIHLLAVERYRNESIDRLRIEFEDRNSAIMAWHRASPRPSYEALCDEACIRK